MPFEKGREKTGGRKSGSTNRNNADLKSRIMGLMEDKFDEVVSDLEGLDPKDRVTAYLKFMEYVLPKQREQKIDLSSLSDAEIDELLNKAMDKLDD